jgi:alkylhydroperoxidase family enzyme
MRKLIFSLGLPLLAAAAFAEEAVPTARPVPLTRPEMKRLLEDMKQRKLRIPLPELTDADREALGERGGSYESRLRYHYLPPGEGSVIGFGFGGPRANRTGSTAPATTSTTPPVNRDFTRNADENMTLSYPFKTRLFWIVSRTNNCQYCLGHQEQKLSAVGMLDDEIAALDSHWERFPPAEQAAFAFARKLTYEPYNLSDADVTALKEFYTPQQILEMTLSVAWNNAINRWKEGSGTPQSHDGSSFFRRSGAELPANRPLPIETFVTPTSAEFVTAVSKVVPVKRDAKGEPTATAITVRGELESRDEVEALLAKAKTRKPRLPLLSEEAAREALGENAPAGTLPNWVRLIAQFPNESRGRVRALNAIQEENGDLSLLLKAQVSWIIARQDRAWYATGVVQKRLKELGQTDEQIFTLDGDWKQFTSADRSLFRFAKHLAATPIALTDDDVAVALKETGPREVVQLINFVTSRAYFDRVTEVAGLPLD